MKKRILMYSAAVLAVLMTATAGQAAATAVVESEITWNCVPGIYDYYGFQGSESYAEANSSAFNDPEYESELNTKTGAYDAEAYAKQGKAWGYGVGSHGLPPYFDAHATASASPPAGVSNSAYASSYQWQLFGVDADGTYTLSADYTITADFVTQCLGDYAGGSAQAYLTIYDYDGTVIEEAGWSDFTNVADGVDESWNVAGVASFSVSLEEGKSYWIDVWADAEALATSSTCVIPVPGTLLLVGLGSGLVGWMRRRKVV